MSILQALAGHYERLVANGEAPDYGYSREPVSYSIVLSPDGAAVDVIDLRDTSGRMPRPSLRKVPRSVTRSSNVAANFLWDKTAYTLGVKLDRNTKQPMPADREHSAFSELHEELLAGTVDEGLRALRSFLDQWRSENYASLRHADDMLDTNVVFRLDGEQRFLHQRAAARRVWRDYLAGKEEQVGLCLVSGEQTPIERLHPKIKRVRGAQSAGASLVSFNLEAFTSFGKKQGANAPVSKRAAFAYTTALNTLLARGSARRIQVGDASTVFWAETAGDEARATAAEDLFSMLAEPPTDAEKAVKVGDKLSDIAAGRPLVDVDPELDENTRFYVLGLAPNAARLSVRFWHVDSIGAIARRIGEHWRDLLLDPPPWTTPPSIWRLLYETAVQRKSENIPPTLSGALMRSILSGKRYPRLLLAAIVMRLRVDGTVSPIRAAIIKACIRRAERLSNPDENKEDSLLSLDRNSKDVAYNLGRLFAAYAYAEKSIANRNATIRDRYMGAASATPRRVFPILMRGYEHNRSGLAKATDHKMRAAGVRTDKAVGQILEQLPGSGNLPAALPLEDQARFFVGYYHQERAFYTKSDSMIEPS